MFRPISRFLPLAACVAAAVSMPSCAAFKKKQQDVNPSYANDADYVNGTPLPDRQEGVSFFGANVDHNRFAPVYFGFDSYAISPNERPKIAEAAAYQRSAGKLIIIGGFTDERGTPEYNRGLGERRALAVRQAMIAAGADAGRLQTVSFGAENPADPGSGEAAWARNRRAEFGVER